MKRALKHLLWIIPSILVIAVVSLASYAAMARNTDRTYHAKLQKTIQVSSKSFQNEQEIPVEFSCKGKSTAPAVQWTKPADGAKSYALITMDWDAPSPSLRLFPITHWVLYNIPPDMMEIPEGSTNADLTRSKIVPGLNIAGQPGYAAPCPPLGTHRYEFRIYALDADQINPVSNDRAGLLKSMEGHVLGYGELVGLKSP
jgi:Raf kinase inhibitor-like YbhB/YbcL family protein